MKRKIIYDPTRINEHKGPTALVFYLVLGKLFGPDWLGTVQPNLEVEAEARRADSSTTSVPPSNAPTDLYTRFSPLVSLTEKINGCNWGAVGSLKYTKFNPRYRETRGKHRNLLSKDFRVFFSFFAYAIFIMLLLIFRYAVL